MKHHPGIRLLSGNEAADGSIIVSILLMMVFLTGFILNLMILANSNLVRARTRVFLLEAQYAAESGADAAIAILNNTDPAYAGTGGSEVQVLYSTQYKATYMVSVAAGSSGKEKIITATGKVYAPKTAVTPTSSRKIEVIAQRS